MSSDDPIDAAFTLLESPEVGSRGLLVRRVTDADKKVVRRCGGFLFATKAEGALFSL
jgi:hypothetical protein